MAGKGTNALIRAWLLAALLLAALAAAQEAGDDEAIGPAVDTSAQIDERESLEPGVPSAVLAAEITRREEGSQVMDVMQLDRAEITGNQELPKVLYIVPWKKSDPGDLIGRPVNTLLDEVLAPLDREEFIRQVDYYDDLYGDDE
jgi:hypothetical protein